MPRQPRLILPGVAAHIIQRGNDRKACFREPSDYLLYLTHLRELAAKHACSVHAYCLMTNHVHLLVTPSTAQACTGLMRDLGQRFVQYFNKRYARTGTLWEGRYRSSIVESARYVLACYRYIELNPVRAGMTADPAGYDWSSHAENAGYRPQKLVVPHAEFAALAVDVHARDSAYRALFRSEFESSVLKDIRDAANGGYPLGSDSFKAALSVSSSRRIARGKAGRPKKDPGRASSKSGSDPDLFEIGL